MLSVNPVKPGTHTYAQVWLSEPQLIFYDPTILPPNPPINTAQLTLNPLKLTLIPISPQLVTATGKASVIQIDFDMLDMIQSITTNLTTGNLTVAATPAITVTTIAAAGSGSPGFGEIDDLVGFVRSVTIPPPGNLGIYDGSFTLQLLSASITPSSPIPVNLTSTTPLYGFSALNQLVTDSFMEVDAYIDVDGNFVATSVEDEYAGRSYQRYTRRNWTGYLSDKER